MRVFGIDPGNTVTGYSVVDNTNQGIHAVVWGTIRPPRNTSYPLRIKYIYERLTEYIREFNPGVIAIEEIFVAVNPRSALKLGQVRGVSLLAAIQSNAEVVEYTALQIKQSVVGYGRATKEQVQEMVTRLLKLKDAPTPFDASDALAVAICHIHSSSFLDKVQAAQEKS